jgi:hypothetical protein
MVLETTSGEQLQFYVKAELRGVATSADSEEDAPLMVAGARVQLCARQRLMIEFVGRTDLAEGPIRSLHHLLIPAVIAPTDACDAHPTHAPSLGDRLQVSQRTGVASRPLRVSLMFAMSGHDWSPPYTGESRAGRSPWMDLVEAGTGGGRAVAAHGGGALAAGCVFTDGEALAEARGALAPAVDTAADFVAMLLALPALPPGDVAHALRAAVLEDVVEELCWDEARAPPPTAAPPRTKRTRLVPSPY